MNRSKTAFVALGLVMLAGCRSMGPQFATTGDTTVESPAAHASSGPSQSSAVAVAPGSKRINPYAFHNGKNPYISQSADGANPYRKSNPNAIVSAAAKPRSEVESAEQLAGQPRPQPRFQPITSQNAADYAPLSGQSAYQPAPAASTDAPAPPEPLVSPAGN